MNHDCSAALIRCMDYRLTFAINEWIQKNGLMNDCDIISVAGAGKELIDEPESAATQYILKQIDISERLHNIKTVYLMHHTDCGAYGGSAAFGDLRDEKKKQMDDMKAAAAVITENFPSLDVKMALAEIKSETDIEIYDL